MLSHPFAEEKLWSHRVFVSIARALSNSGHAVLRFDYMGAGDSSGTTPETSLETHRADLLGAIGQLVRLQPEIRSVGLIGLRLGATIAAQVAEMAGPHETAALVTGAPLVLWDPIMDGSAYFQELLRSNLTTQLAVYGRVRENREALTQKILSGGTVNVDGYEIGRELLESCGASNLLTAAPKCHAGPAMIAQISPTKASKERENLRALTSSYPDGTFQVIQEQAFWKEIKPFYGSAKRLQQATMEWLESLNG